MWRVPTSTQPHPESFRAVADQARRDANLTVEDFAFEISRAAKAAGMGRAGTSVSSVQKHLSGGLTSSPSVQLMELAAKTLKVPPSVFAEYRLAMARRALDETEVGYDEALARLKRFEELRPAEGAGRASQRGQAAGRPGRASTRAGRSPEGG